MDYTLLFKLNSMLRTNIHDRSSAPGLMVLPPPPACQRMTRRNVEAVYRGSLLQIWMKLLNN